MTAALLPTTLFGTMVEVGYLRRGETALLRDIVAGGDATLPVVVEDFGPADEGGVYLSGRYEAPDGFGVGVTYEDSSTLVEVVSYRPRSWEAIS